MPPHPDTVAKFERALVLIRGGQAPYSAFQTEFYDAQGAYRHMRRYPEFKQAFEDALAVKEVNQADRRPVEDMGLEEFREKVLGRKTYTHMREWLEWMEDPEADHIMIVTHPDSAKTTFVLDYLLWRFARDTDLRVSYASLAEKMAQKNLARVKGVIESNKELKKVAGEMCPGPGDPHPWANTHFMIRQRSFQRGEDEADATMRAYGMGSQIASTRADIFVVDDPDQEGLGDREREENFEKLMMTIESRLTIGGKLILILNRWGENDLASKVIAQEAADPGLWKIHTSRAIRREANPYRTKLDSLGRVQNDPDWGEVSWPEKFGTTTGRPGDPWTLERAWEFFAKKRRRLGPRRFNIQYQNDPGASEDREFTEEDIANALQRGSNARWGVVPAGSLVVCAQDPAGDTGGAATIAVALTPNGPQVVDIMWDRNVGHLGLVEWIKQFNRYHPSYWGIEAQGGYQLYVKDKEVKAAVAPAFLYDMHTNQNKHAEGVGVTSLVPVVANELIIPSSRPEDVERMQALCDQLRAYRRPKWDPDQKKAVQVKGTFDCVMALWLAFRTIRDKNLVPKDEQVADRNAWQSGYGNSFKGGGFTLSR